MKGARCRETQLGPLGRWAAGPLGRWALSYTHVPAERIEFRSACHRPGKPVAQTPEGGPSLLPSVSLPRRADAAESADQMCVRFRLWGLIGYLAIVVSVNQANIPTGL